MAKVCVGAESDFGRVDVDEGVGRRKAAVFVGDRRHVEDAKLKVGRPEGDGEMGTMCCVRIDAIDAERREESIKRYTVIGSLRPICVLDVWYLDGWIIDLG